jgi:hypothetical protein
MEQVLLLNITYEPLRIINWKKAITMLCLGKVEVIEEYGLEIHSVSFTIKLPSVVRLLRMVKRPKTPVKISMQEIVIIVNMVVIDFLQRISPMTMSYLSPVGEGRNGRTS